MTRESPNELFQHGGCLLSLHSFLCCVAGIAAPNLLLNSIMQVLSRCWSGCYSP